MTRVGPTCWSDFVGRDMVTTKGENRMGTLFCGGRLYRLIFKTKVKADIEAHASFDEPDIFHAAAAAAGPERWVESRYRDPDRYPAPPWLRRRELPWRRGRGRP